MPSKSGYRKRHQLWQLWHRQKGRCHYCDKETVIRFRQNGGHALENEATLEHLDDRFSGGRGSTGGYRRVMACHECNHAKGVEGQRAAGIDELRKRSKMHRVRG